MDIVALATGLKVIFIVQFLESIANAAAAAASWQQSCSSSRCSDVSVDPADLLVSETC